MRLVGLVCLVAGCSDPTSSPADLRTEAVAVDLAPTTDAADLSSRQDAGATDQAADATEVPRPVWFLHVTDLHLGASAYAAEALGTFLDYVVPAVSPTATLVTGDITDGGSSGQWSTYLAAIQGKVAPYPVHLEIPGNHDMKVDSQGFVTGTQTGAAGGGMYGLSYVDAIQGRVEVVRTNTSDSSKALEQLLGRVSEAQVTDLEALPPSPVPVAHSVVLGHHPIDGVQGLKVLGTDGRMEQLLTHFAAEVYLCGHTHVSHLSWKKTTLVVQSPTLGKPEIATPNPGFALVALEQGGPSARFFGLTKSSPAVVDWPLTLITSPPDSGLGGANPLAKPLSPGNVGLSVRVLAFSPAGILAVEVRVDGGAWRSLDGTDKPLWQGNLATPAAGKHSLEARALSTEGTGTHTTGFVVGP